jgi:serine/threonine protein phosphatase PrpC
VLEDREIESHVSGADAARACRSLIDGANARGTYDNVTAAVVRLTGAVPAAAKRSGVGATLRRLALGWR